MKRKAKGKPQPATPSTDAAVPAKPDPRGIVISQYPDESAPDAMGRNAIRPTLNEAMAIKEYQKRYGDDLEVMGLVKALSSEANKVHGGDLARAEHMLIVQAHTLDAIFSSLAQRAALNFGEYLDAAEQYMRLALKAQGQCRATLETLALIKNPPNVAFVRQANIAHGPQQVNNGPAPADDRSRAGETENQQNKLLEAQHGEGLDTGTAGTASGADPAMATMDAINGATNGKG